MAEEGASVGGAVQLVDLGTPHARGNSTFGRAKVTVHEPSEWRTESHSIPHWGLGSPGAAHATQPPPHWAGVERSRASGRLRVLSKFSFASFRRPRFNFHWFSRTQRCLSCATVAGAVSLSCVNIIAWKIPLFKDIFRPAFPRLTPASLLLVAATLAAVGCKTRVDIESSDMAETLVDDSGGTESRDTEDNELEVAQLPSSRFPCFQRCSCRVLHRIGEGIKSCSPGGENFHRKVYVLQAIKMVNMTWLLKANMSTGQEKFWILCQVAVILVNSFCVPHLYFKEDPKYSTVGMTLFDLTVDAVYGAVIPICMLFHLGVYTMVNAHEFIRVKTPRSEQARALVVGTRYVPGCLSDLATLVIPYLSFAIRLADIKKARHLLKTKALQRQGRRPFMIQYKGIMQKIYWTAGVLLAFAVLCRLFLIDGCKDLRAPWAPACLQQSYFTTKVCSCIYFHFKAKKCPDHDAESSELPLALRDLEDMLSEAGPSLRVLSVWCYWNQTFPSLEQNPRLIWLFLHHGDIEEVPSLHKNTLLDRLVVREQKLRVLPSLAGLTQLKWLDVQSNHLTEIQNLDEAPCLERIMVSNNQLTELPSIDSFVELRKLRAASNELHSLPSLSKNVKLSVLDLSENNLTALPPLTANTRLTELKASDNKLEELPELSTNRNLAWLEVQDNRLRTLPSFEFNPNIGHLNVSGNMLTHFPASISDGINKNLTVVDVCRNHFEEPFPSSALREIKKKDKGECRCCETYGVESTLP